MFKLQARYVAISPDGNEQIIATTEFGRPIAENEIVSVVHDIARAAAATGHPVGLVYTSIPEQNLMGQEQFT